MGWSYSHVPLSHMFRTKNGVGFKVEGSQKVFSKKDLYRTKAAVKEALVEIIGDGYER